MPLARFRCPDGARIKTMDCLLACRMPARCLTRATLQVIAKDRKWDGVPHVTGLLNGTMLEFLKITEDYCISPKSKAFALLGSSHHKLLELSGDLTPEESLAQEGMVSELHLNNGWMQGTLDLLEQEAGELSLVDFKAWGSNRLVRDKPSGVTFDPKKTPVDLLETGLQINAYRVMLEQQYGWKVTRMQVQCTVRDGGLAAATKRGVKESMYLLPIGRLEDSMVVGYFQARAQMLATALSIGGYDICTPDERWHGNRCKGYCEVAEHCPEGGKYS